MDKHFVLIIGSEANMSFRRLKVECIFSDLFRTGSFNWLFHAGSHPINQCKNISLYY